MNPYRTHTCAALRKSDIGSSARLCGFVENIRDHGGILFIDLRDFYGITQVVVEKLPAGVTRECSLTAAGRVVARSAETVNPKLETGEVELHADKITVLGRVNGLLPFEIPSSHEVREEVRLKYRFLDLRNPRVKDNLVLRAKVNRFLRSQMEEQGFLEVQTPILTASSPEGARDFLVPSRKYKGRFYALPQAPQQFKQLLMAGGFDKYYQLAPCFRDEDARADRSPGEFYQLDYEMAFSTQEDVLAVCERTIYALFKTFSSAPLTPAPFPRIPYREAMLRYGTDKPDLRNPLQIVDATPVFVNTTFAAFSHVTVRAINLPGGASRPKSFYENMLGFAMGIGMKGLGYLKVNPDGSFAGPIDKFLSPENRQELTLLAALKPGDVLFFIADQEQTANEFAGKLRTELGERCGLMEENAFSFCFIVDFPLFEPDENGKPVFTHNPFSLPQGGAEALAGDPYEILAYQYDLVINGIEAASGAVRNHDPAIMEQVFAIAGYDKGELEFRFGALYHAFGYGAPPHAGMAPGIDRILMLLCGEKNIREVIAFPLSSGAQDLLLGAPSLVSEAQLRDVHIKIR